jgi:hypothetical protein
MNIARAVLAGYIGKGMGRILMCCQSGPSPQFCHGLGAVDQTKRIDSAINVHATHGVSSPE